MKINVLSKPNSKNPRIKKLSAGDFIVAVKEPAIESRANQAVIIALADYFGKPPSNIRIISGRKSKKKVIEIL